MLYIYICFSAREGRITYFSWNFITIVTKRIANAHKSFENIINLLNKRAKWKCEFPKVSDSLEGRSPMPFIAPDSVS